MSNSYQVNEKGFYGEYGGAFIPEMLLSQCGGIKTELS